MRKTVTCPKCGNSFRTHRARVTCHCCATTFNTLETPAMGCIGALALLAGVLSPSGKRDKAATPLFPIVLVVLVVLFLIGKGCS